jgi:hypothetical protein
LNRDPYLPNLVPFTQSPQNYQLKMASWDSEQAVVKIIRRCLENSSGVDMNHLAGISAKNRQYTGKVV